MKKKAKQLMYPGRDGMVPPSALVSMNNVYVLCWLYPFSWYDNVSILKRILGHTYLICIWASP